MLRDKLPKFVLIKTNILSILMLVVFTMGLLIESNDLLIQLASISKQNVTDSYTAF